MQIFIHLPQNEIITLDVDSNSTISKLKNQIYRKDGVPVNMQRLIFGGKQLIDDTKCMNDYGITKECVILMLIKNNDIKTHSFVNLIENLLYYFDLYILSKFYS